MLNTCTLLHYHHHHRIYNFYDFWKGFFFHKHAALIIIRRAIHYVSEVKFVMNGMPLIGCNFLNVKNTHYIDNQFKYTNNNCKAFWCCRLTVNLKVYNSMITILKLFSFLKLTQQKPEIS